MSLKRTSSAAGLPDRTDDDAPCCWLCLEEGPDDSGKPLCRDCSCRGTSGYAHLSCMVTYAERKGKEAYENDSDLPFEHFFETCPNCNQEYQGAVQFDMATARLEFVEREYKNDLVLNIEALLDKISHLMYSLELKGENHKQEGEDLSSKLLPMIEQMKKNASMDRHKRLIADVNFVLADFFRQIGGNDYLEKAKKHFMQAKDFYEEIGEDHKTTVQVIEMNIRLIAAKLNGTEAELGMNTKEEIEYWRFMYNDSIKSVGESNLCTLNCGFGLSRALSCAKYCIEAERLLCLLVDTCQRVHGVEHNVTKRYSVALKNAKVREVMFVTPQDEDFYYQALRYENNGEKIVVQGPYLTERNVEDEKVLTVESKDVIPMLGTPVIVHSLPEKCMSHLNGKIGDIRAYSEDNRTCEIHFEEEGLDPTGVKCENLRILFDLPEKEETEDTE